jgi:TonB-like protein
MLEYDQVKSGSRLRVTLISLVVNTCLLVAPVFAVLRPPWRRAPVRVGGRVKEPTLITRVDPRYPALAIQTHMQGTVVVEAIIDENGDVVEAKVVSGPPLLMQSALDAVRQ